MHVGRLQWGTKASILPLASVEVCRPPALKGINAIQHLHVPPQPTGMEFKAGLSSVCQQHPTISVDGWLAGHCPSCLAMGLEAMAGWLKQSWLILNPSKMEVLRLGYSRSSLGYQLPALDSVSLILSQTIKSLGMTLDASLTTEAQVTKDARLAFL